MHGGEVAVGERRFDVTGITRVEGEGSLRLAVRDGNVTEAHLAIFEAPRYFEQLVLGRTPDDVLDIVARICGICPVAYQMSAVHAFEDLLGVVIDPSVRALRRLLYCGEWIESHALHVYLLHAPDFAGLASAVELARVDRAAVERGLAIKRVGNRLVSLLGGRPIHPVSVRVGGFSRVPRAADLAQIRPELDDALRGALATMDWVAGFSVPDFERDPLLVSLRHATDYPMNEGRIVSNDGMDIEPGAWESAFQEQQVPWSHALQARDRDGRAYLLGPASRVTLAGEQLHPLALAALDRSGLATAIARNPYWGIAARAVEIVHAVAVAIEIIDGYGEPARPMEPWAPGPGIAAWATEAPRGLLFHRYRLDERGRIAEASIVPPTSQNQAAIEADLTAFAPMVLGLDHAAATHRFEQLIRSYDPCISCATHFLDLRVEDQS
ncbi:MAG: nickel-dependent hydrogenase large subunit [Chloroflexota bacterium]|nr:nickel-dependent hydrogenase large subunit [Chloroflexota bacterium]